MLKKFKKNISIAMTAALIVAQLPVMTSFAADAVAIDENFNSLNAGNVPDGWTATSTGTNSVGAVEVESGNMAIDLNADTPGTEVSLKSPTFNYDKFTVSYKVKFDDTSVYQGLFGNDGSTLCLFCSENWFGIRYNGSNYYWATEAEANRWYDIKLLVDNTTYTVELLIDNTFITKGKYFRNNNKVTQLNFNINTDKTAGYMIDDVKVEEGADFTYENFGMDFSSASSDDATTFYPDKSGVVSFANNGNLSHFDIVDGKFGKATGDKSLYAHNDAGTIISGSGDPYAAVDFTQTSVGAEIASGDIAALDLRVAFSEAMSPIRFQGFAYSENNSKDGKLGYDMIILESNGKLSAFGQEYDMPIPMEPNVWYDFHIEVYAGNTANNDPNKYSVWLNSMPIVQDKEFTLNTRGTDGYVARSRFLGFKQIWINPRFNDLKNSDGSYKASGFYVDDIRYTVKQTDVEFLEMDLSHENSDIDRYINHTYGIFTDDSTTINDIKGINVTNGQLEAVRNASGTELTTGSVAGGYLDVVGYDCRHEYIPLHTSNYSKTVDGSEINVASDTQYNANGKWVAFNNTNGANSYNNAYGPVAGRAEGDKSFAIVSGTAKNEGDLLNYVMQAPNAEKVNACYLPLTTEFSVYTDSNVGYFYTLLYFDGKTSGGDAKIIFKIQDSQLWIGNDVAHCNIGWNRVAMTTYPGKDYVDVYLNGEYVGKIATGAYQYVNMMRVSSERKTEGAVAALDDFKQYSGKYVPTEQPSLTAKDNISDKATVDENKKTIKMPSSDIAGDALQSYLNMDCDVYYLYTNAALNQTTDTVANNSVLVLRKGNEFVDYTVITEENNESIENEDIVAKQTFDSVSASNISVGGSNSEWFKLDSTTSLIAYAMCTTMSISGGVADKSNSDKCIVFKGENVDSTKGVDPFIKFVTATGSSLTTLDFQMYMDGDVTARIQALKQNGKAVTAQLEFYPDGSVTFFGIGVDNFNWKTETANSKWMNVSMSMNADTGRTILIINNKLIADRTSTSGLIAAYGYKFESRYSQDNQSGLLAIDNLHFYKGLPQDYAIEFTGYSNGNVSGKYDVGEYTVKCNVLSYAKELPVMLAIAEYEPDGKLKQLKTQEYKVSGSDTIEESINIESTDGELKVFAWNSDNLKPYVTCKTIEPKGKGTVKMFPGFTTKAVTIGFDDGRIEDKDVIKVLDKYGAKATFNVVGSRLTTNFGTNDHTSIAKVYKNHEIANHTYKHLPSFLMEGQTSQDSYGNVLKGCSKQEAIDDVLTNKTFLENNLGVTTRGIAWPNGYPQDTRTDYEEIEQELRNNGYVYARYSESGNFDLPTDMMKWAPTCHISSMAQQAERFVNADDSEGPKLFYFWGHSYEFLNDSGVMDTTALEEVLQTLSQANIWYATNGEVYDYVTALSKVTQTGDIITNASDMEVYLNVNGKNIKLAAGAEYRIIEPPHIVCWGDSLTYGAESTNPTTKSYPAVLANLSGAQVDNMGVPGETTTTIAARQGVLDIVLSNDITIPASGSVSIEFEASNGGKVAPRDVNVGGWNPCSIDGVQGNLNVVIDTTVWPRVVKSATFTRSTAGESKSVPARTQIKVVAQEVKGDINIIFSGTNGGWTVNNLTENDSHNNSDEIAGFVQLLKAQAQYSLNSDKYIVIGLTINDDYYWSMVDTAMQQEFGEHFFNLRKALASEQLLTDHGITPTATDTECIGRGAVPKSILAADGTHFNDTGYQIIAELVYEKLQQLGYIN